MKVIFDADSLIYASCFKKKEDREDNDDLFIEDVQEALDKFNKGLNYFIDDLSEQIEVSELIVCNGSKRNFRNEVSKEYKANRTSKRPSVLSELHNQVKLQYNSYWGDGVETDDIVATLWNKEVIANGIHSVVIASLDKDYKQFPCWFYDYHYKKRELIKITEEEALHNFYSQMIVGDPADNINYCKGFGKAYAKKAFKSSKNEFSFIRNTYKLYKEIYGSDARDMYNEAKLLLTLKKDAYDNIRR